jgi:hypothetical protein
LALPKSFKSDRLAFGNAIFRRVERIPVVQAILRKVAVSAANGNTRAQQTFLTLLVGAETDRRMATMEMLTSAVEYKERWGAILEMRERTGTTGSEPVPHPDDVVIDRETGEVSFSGPVMLEQKAAWDKLHAMWPDLERQLADINKQIDSDPNDPILREEQAKFTEMIDSLRADALKRSLRNAKKVPPDFEGDLPVIMPAQR